VHTCALVPALAEAAAQIIATRSHRAAFMRPHRHRRRRAAAGAAPRHTPTLFSAYNDDGQATTLAWLDSTTDSHKTRRHAARPLRSSPRVLLVGLINKSGGGGGGGVCRSGHCRDVLARAPPARSLARSLYTPA